MRPDNWHLTEDLDDFLARAGDFLHSRPVLHTMPLTVTETLRTHGANAYGAEAPVFGRLERAGEVHATFFRTPPHQLSLTPLTPDGADTLAAHLADLGHPLPGVNADHDTATAFAEAWQRHTGTTATLRERRRLYRLGTLTPPQPFPEGRGRIAGKQDREQLVRWHHEFGAATREAPTLNARSPDAASLDAASLDAASRAATRFADKRVMFWETPDGTPVSMAGVTPLIAGQIRVAPVYTPAHLRGRGYAGAVTAEVSRAALAAGAAHVVLFANLKNLTSNDLYQRIGYVPVTDFTMYGFSGATGEIARR